MLYIFIDNILYEISLTFFDNSRNNNNNYVTIGKSTFILGQISLNMTYALIYLIFIEYVNNYEEIKNSKNQFNHNSCFRYVFENYLDRICKKNNQSDKVFIEFATFWIKSSELVNYINKLVENESIINSIPIKLQTQDIMTSFDPNVFNNKLSSKVLNIPRISLNMVSGYFKINYDNDQINYRFEPDLKFLDPTLQCYEKNNEFVPCLPLIKSSKNLSNSPGHPSGMYTKFISDETFKPKSFPHIINYSLPIGPINVSDPFFQRIPSHMPQCMFYPIQVNNFAQEQLHQLSNNVVPLVNLIPFMPNNVVAPVAPMPNNVAYTENEINVANILLSFI